MTQSAGDSKAELSDTADTVLKEQNKSLLLKLGLPGIAVFVVMIWVVSQLSPGSPQAPTDAAASGELVTAQAEQEELNALAATKRRSATRLVEDATARLTDLRSEVTLWNQSIVTLPQGERGRAIAADKSYVEAFGAILRKDHAQVGKLERYKQDLDRLIEPVNTSAGKPSAYVPNDSLLDELRTIKDAIEDDVAEYRADRESIEAMLDAAEAAGLKSADSLEQALADAEREAALKRAAIIKEKTTQAEGYAAEVEGDAKADQIRRLADQEATRIRAETEARERQADMDILRAKAADPDIQAKYAPFLTKSYVRIIHFLKRTDVPRPCSYSELVQMGALENHTTFARVGSGRRARGTGSMKGHGRPTWVYPTTEEGFERYRELYAEFMELAPIWKQTGVLAP